MHSPLPWKIEERVSQGVFVIGNIPDGYDKTICTMRWTSGLGPVDLAKTDAEFIVRACNSHADLLETLEKLIEAVEYVPYDDLSEQTKPIQIERAAIRARQAIAKASN